MTVAEEICSLVRTLVWRGTHSPLDIATEVRSDFGELDEANKHVLFHAIQSEFETKLKEEATWPKVTDFDRLDGAFTVLEAQGIIALHLAGFTLSDGVEDVADAYEEETRVEKADYRGHCFYTTQDQEYALTDNCICIAFGHTFLVVKQSISRLDNCWQPH